MNIGVKSDRWDAPFEKAPEGVIREEIAEHAHHHLGAQRRAGNRGHLIQQAIPVRHALLRFVEERAIGLSLDQRQQPLQRVFQDRRRERQLLKAL